MDGWKYRSQFFDGQVRIDGGKLAPRVPVLVEQSGANDFILELPVHAIQRLSQQSATGTE